MPAAPLQFDVYTPTGLVTVSSVVHVAGVEVALPRFGEHDVPAGFSLGVEGQGVERVRQIDEEEEVTRGAARQVFDVDDIGRLDPARQR